MLRENDFDGLKEIDERKCRDEKMNKIAVMIEVRYKKGF